MVHELREHNQNIEAPSGEINIIGYLPSFILLLLMRIKHIGSFFSQEKTVYEQINVQYLF